MLNCLYRKTKPPLESRHLNWVRGDLKQAEQLDPLFEKTGVLIHCASVISIGEGNQDEVYETNVIATEKLIRQCLEREVRLVYISSSTATRPLPDDGILDEASPRVNSKDFFYGWTKARAEERIMHSCE